MEGMLICLCLILKLHLLGWTEAEIGNVMNLTQVRVHQVIINFKENLKTYIISYQKGKSIEKIAFENVHREDLKLLEKAKAVFEVFKGDEEFYTIKFDTDSESENEQLARKVNNVANKIHLKAVEERKELNLDIKFNVETTYYDIIATSKLRNQPEDRKKVLEMRVEGRRGSIIYKTLKKLNGAKVLCICYVSMLG